VSQVEPGPRAVEPGTLMQKPIPPRMVEPYLTGRRSVISGFVYRVADSMSARPRELHRLFGLGYAGSEFAADADEIYVLRWRAVSSQPYQVPYSAEHGGDWAMKPPFSGAGYVSAADRSVPEFFTDPMPVPVGAEIHRIGAGMTDFIARYDGQVWLRPAEGPGLCATG
jgi:hypothetical protein